jgi:subfamily B ATP-binding cassette protein MsbA
VAAGFTQSIQEPVAISIMVFLLIVQVTLFNQTIAPVLVAIMMFYRALGSAFSMQISLQNTFAYSGNFEMVYNEFISQDNFKSKDGFVKIGPFNSGIYFENVSFYFDDKINPTLKNLNFFIPAKKSVAFVGQSGAGKSTLIDLITFLLEPRSGCIKIDEVSSSDIELSSWRSQIGFVSQETVVFDDSLANNICLWDGNPNIDVEVMNRVIAAAKKAHIADYIETLEEGYNTQVGDRGVKLSGGQKQRLFIARELFRNPSVLILDEATSSLDSESELIVQRSIDNLKGSTTLIIIAHRLSTIKNVDCIFVLDNGVIVESGSYEELSNLENSVFKGLINAQSL